MPKDLSGIRIKKLIQHEVRSTDRRLKDLAKNASDFLVGSDFESFVSSMNGLRYRHKSLKDLLSLIAMVEGKIPSAYDKS